MAYYSRGGGASGGVSSSGGVGGEGGYAPHRYRSKTSIATSSSTSNSLLDEILQTADSIAQANHSTFDHAATNQLPSSVASASPAAGRYNLLGGGSASLSFLSRQAPSSVTVKPALPVRTVKVVPDRRCMFASALNLSDWDYDYSSSDDDADDDSDDSNDDSSAARTHVDPALVVFADTRNGGVAPTRAPRRVLVPPDQRCIYLSSLQRDLEKAAAVFDNDPSSWVVIERTTPGSTSMHSQYHPPTVLDLGERAPGPRRNSHRSRSTSSPHQSKISQPQPQPQPQPLRATAMPSTGATFQQQQQQPHLLQRVPSSTLSSASSASPTSLRASSSSIQQTQPPSTASYRQTSSPIRSTYSGPPPPVMAAPSAPLHGYTTSAPPLTSSSRTLTTSASAVPTVYQQSLSSPQRYDSTYSPINLTRSTPGVATSSYSSSALSSNNSSIAPAASSSSLTSSANEDELAKLIDSAIKLLPPSKRKAHQQVLELLQK